MSDTHSLLDSVTGAFVPVNHDGHKFIGIAAVVTVILFLLAPPLGWLGVMATAYCAYFFRDPERVVPSRPGAVVSAADGKISSIAEVRAAARACARRCEADTHLGVPVGA